MFKWFTRKRDAKAHPSYGAFMEWMTTNKGGARQCPKGDFPRNFHYWISGGRW